MEGMEGRNVIKINSISKEEVAETQWASGCELEGEREGFSSLERVSGMLKLTNYQNDSLGKPLWIRIQDISAIQERTGEGDMNRNWTEIQVGNLKYDVTEPAGFILKHIAGKGGILPQLSGMGTGGVSPVEIIEI